MHRQCRHRAFSPDEAVPGPAAARARTHQPLAATPARHPHNPRTPAAQARRPRVRALRAAVKALPALTCSSHAAWSGRSAHVPGRGEPEVHIRVPPAGSMRRSATEARGNQDRVYRAAARQASTSPGPFAWMDTVTARASPIRLSCASADAFHRLPDAPCRYWYTTRDGGLDETGRCSWQSLYAGSKLRTRVRLAHERRRGLMPELGSSRPPDCRPNAGSSCGRGTTRPR